jgi:hypothetical protein
MSDSPPSSPPCEDQQADDGQVNNEDVVTAMPPAPSAPPFNNANSIDAKGAAFINTWQSVEQSIQQKIANFPKLKEQPGPTALAINLGYIPVKNTIETLEKASADEVKNNPGVRTTFLIVKMLFPGWSSVATSQDKDQPAAKASKFGKGKAAPEIKEKLSSTFGEHVLLHSYDLVNQRGTYVRSGKSDQCAAFSPGMVISTKVWGAKFIATFKDQVKDINIFDIVAIQFGLKNIQSAAMESGMMLDIKSFQSIPEISASSFRILRSVVIPTSLQEAAVNRSRFVDGSYLVGEGGDGPKGLCQDMIKGIFSSTVALVRVTPTQSNGVFAMGADNKLRFHVNEPIADLPCPEGGTLVVHYDPEVFYGTSHDSTKDDWVSKLFNIAMLLKSVELIVNVDTYKSSKSSGNESDEMVVDCFARLDVCSIISKMIEKKGTILSPGPKIKAILGASEKYFAAFECGNSVQIAIDMRRVTKKSNNGSGSIKGSILHNDSTWEHAHKAVIFFNDRLVHCFTIPVNSSFSSAQASDGSGMVLDSISLPANFFNSDEDLEFETWDDDSTTKEKNSSTTGANAAAKKRKRAQASQ